MLVTLMKLKFSRSRTRTLCKGPILLEALFLFPLSNSNMFPTCEFLFGFGRVGIDIIISSWTQTKYI